MKRSAAVSLLVDTRSMEMGFGPTPAPAHASPQNGWSPGRQKCTHNSLNLCVIRYAGV